MNRTTTLRTAIAALLLALAAACTAGTTGDSGDESPPDNCGDTYYQVVEAYSTEIVQLQDGSLTCEEICTEEHGSPDTCSWSFDDPNEDTATSGASTDATTSGGAGSDGAGSTGGADGSTGAAESSEGSGAPPGGSVAYVSCGYVNECVG